MRISCEPSFFCCSVLPSTIKLQQQSSHTDSLRFRSLYTTQSAPGLVIRCALVCLVLLRSINRHVAEQLDRRRSETAQWLGLVFILYFLRPYAKHHVKNFFRSSRAMYSNKYVVAKLLIISDSNRRVNMSQNTLSRPYTTKQYIGVCYSN